MPFNIRIIHAHDFMKVTPEGQLDLQSSRELLIEIAANSAPLADHHILLDIRRAHSSLSVTDLYYLAGELNEHRKALSRRTAVLCPTEMFDFAGFFALCAQNRGFPVSAFTSFEKAIEWLVEIES